MSEKLIPAKGKEVVKVLGRAGYHLVRQKGSHFIISDGIRIVVVPCHGNAELPKGTQRGIIRDAGLTVDEFNDLLRK